MMLTANPFYAQQNLYTPSRPSPLSERHVNAVPRAFNFTMGAQPQTEKMPVPQRAYKPNPVMQSRDAVKERRREMFFKRVQKDRDDRKWEVRGEQIQLLDFMSEQKRWEAEKARQAMQLEVNNFDFLEDELENLEGATPSYDLSNASHNEPRDEAEYISQEDQELEAFIAAIEEEEGQQEVASQHFGSDDEDYDQIFMEYTTGWENQQPSEHGNCGFDDMDVMDTT
ncbi:hypothetical protein CC78DRAFT_618684 [Lojkania enalia]|uniref:Uncharacterized protein n=1 Tax=Lojkania enalia TaxID=147567 RepID=A0A9P4K937_9PLEO|nr:hypothetical protein CC78DRAFT_618684 [Didymosphaeria enalia]